MVKELNCRSPLAGTVVVSLVTVIACGSAADALGSVPPTSWSAKQPELSARVAVLAERIRKDHPALLSRVAPERKMAQWRNY